MTKPTRNGIRVWVSLPPRELHPNGGKRVHHMKLNRLFAKRKQDAALLAVEALNGCRIAEAPDYAVRIEVFEKPRAASKMDRNNVQQWFKADCDGISRAIGVDDKHFRSAEIPMPQPEPDRSQQGAWIEVWAVDGNNE